MRKIITILLLCMPTLAWAQPYLTAPGATHALPTTMLTGKEEFIYLFDNLAAISLKAEQTNGNIAEFIWMKLNTANVTLDLYQQENGVLSSTINITEEGGYQVIVHDLVDLTTDTLTTWVFRDTFRLDGVDLRHNDCGELNLRIRTTPSFYSYYSIYHFKRFLYDRHLPSETRIALIGSVQWTPVNIRCKDNSTSTIFPNVNNPETAWTTRRQDIMNITSPPPLCNAAYHLEITNAFGKSLTYTTPVITAVATKAIPKVEEKDGISDWKKLTEAPKGEALYEVRFLHDSTANANHYEWKGFDNARKSNGDRTVVWTESTTDINAKIYPKMPYRNNYVQGYTPGSYLVRLTVRNEHGCKDSTTIGHIVVESSKFDADAIPNAFTPNAAHNNYFTFSKDSEIKSMEHISVHIYNRSGGLVYRYEGRSDAWKGWDGRRMGTGSDVAAGVYFYVISGRGWDEIDYNTKEYSGYLHLFR